MDDRKVYMSSLELIYLEVVLVLWFVGFCLFVVVVVVVVVVLFCNRHSCHMTFSIRQVVMILCVWE